MISVRNLSLTLRGNTILEDVSFEIQKGQYVGLIGPNGAGKTSLIKTLLGFYAPSSGDIRMESNLRVGYVPQSYALSGVVPISVGEVLSMSGVYAGHCLIQNLKKVELPSSILSQNFHTLSGGQKQRVIIARALATKPDIILFDEPLNNIDFETKLSIYQLLSHLNTSEKLTILFVSHEVDHIIEKCHHVLCLNRTMHTGCHPLDFARGNAGKCPVLSVSPQVVPVHHHHS